MNILAMVSERLKELGADGLCNDEECGCGLNDLAPCGTFPADCVPARADVDYFVPMEIKTHPPSESAL